MSNYQIAYNGEQLNIKFDELDKTLVKLLAKNYNKYFQVNHINIKGDTLQLFSLPTVEQEISTKFIHDFIKKYYEITERAENKVAEVEVEEIVKSQNKERSLLPFIMGFVFVLMSVYFFLVGNSLEINGSIHQVYQMLHTVCGVLSLGFASLMFRRK